MADRCFDLTEFGDLLDLEPGDPRGEHLARCPLCRSRLRAYRAFLEKQPAAGSRPADADAALERYISETVRRSPADRPAGEPGPGIPRLRTLSLRTGPAPFGLVSTIPFRFAFPESDPVACGYGQRTGAHGDGAIDQLTTVRLARHLLRGCRQRERNGTQDEAGSPFWQTTAFPVHLYGNLQTPHFA